MGNLTKAQFKDSVFGELGRIGKALSSGRRLELIEVLAQGERNVEDLARETRMSVANASQHLQVLKQARLVQAIRRGNHIGYRLAGESVTNLWLALRKAGDAQLAELNQIVEAYFHRRASLEAISVAELRDKLARGSVVVLDVRPQLEFEEAHIEGARSMPIEELEARLEEVPKGETIVAYCRGPYCVYAYDAVELLQKNGYRAMRLEAGLLDWRAWGGRIGSGAGC